VIRDLEAKMVLKKNIKLFSQKIWWFKKFALPLQPLSLLKRKQMVLEKKV
jgi:hypothetical protein